MGQGAAAPGTGDMQVVTGGQAPVPGTRPQAPVLATGKILAVGDEDTEELEEATLTELNQLRAQNVFGALADGMPEGSGQRRLVRTIAQTFSLQLVAACLGYLGLALGFSLAVPPDVGSYQGLNFLLYLYLIGCGVYFARFDLGRALASSCALCGMAVVVYGAKLTGFRPALYFLVVQPLVTMFVHVSFATFLEHGARQSVLARSARRSLMKAEERKRTQGGQTDDVLRRMKEGEMRQVQMKTNFSDLLNTLRDLGGALREQDIYETMFRLLGRGLDVKAAELWFVVEGGKMLKVEEAREAAGRQMQPSTFQMALPNDDTSILGFCATRKQAVLPDHLESDGLLRELTRKGPHPTAFCLPIMVQGEVRAVLNASRGPSKLEAHQVALLNTLTQVAAKAFESAHTFQLSESERKAAVNLSQKERDERIRTRETLERFVSSNVVDAVMENPKLSQNMDVTVLLADLRGFTTLSERLTPEVVVEMLNDYFGCLTPLLFKYQGTLDKYIGDMVMALFGPPIATGRDPQNAVRCAIEMRLAFERQFKRKWEPRVQAKLEMGIAMNSGPATVGLLGSDKLVNYTAIGDSVNTASRLEDLTPGGRILITEATFDRVKDEIECRLVGAKSFKGKTEKTKIFEVRGLKAGAAPNPASVSLDMPSPGGAAPSPAPAAPAQPAPAAPPAAAQPTPAAPAPPPAAAAAGGASAPCPLCAAAVPAGAQTCPTCGMRL